MAHAAAVGMGTGPNEAAMALMAEAEASTSAASTGVTAEEVAATGPSVFVAAPRFKPAATGESFFLCLYLAWSLRAQVFARC